MSYYFKASGEDPSCTPGKSRKDGVGGGMYPHSHPTTPQSTAPSPGAASLNSMHEEYPQDNSPTWPRTPASPVSFHIKLKNTYSVISGMKFSVDMYILFSVYHF